MSDSKVISFNKDRKDLTKNTEEAEEAAVTETSFEEVMKANEAKKKKMAEERNKANKSVLRSHRIKN